MVVQVQDQILCSFLLGMSIEIWCDFRVFFVYRERSNVAGILLVQEMSSMEG